MARFKITQAAWLLHDIGVRHHASGVLRDKSGVALYDFYTTDFLSAAQQAAILAACPNAVFRGTYAEFAPEIRGVLICFPKAAMKKRLAAGLPHAA